MVISKKLMFVISAFYASSLAHALDIGFITDNNTTIYTFNPDNTSLPATPIITDIPFPGCITISPDGKTVYFTSNNTPGDVYSFPVAGPYIPTALGTGVDNGVGIAISSDGTTGFVADGTNIWSFPIAGSNHPASQLTATNTVIAFPTFIAISGNTVFVGQDADPSYAIIGVYSFPVNASSYTVTSPIQVGYSISGLTVSDDGFLYFSSSVNANVNCSVFQVPIADPTATPITLTDQQFPEVNDLAISKDGKVAYLAQLGMGSGIFYLPTDQFVQNPNLLAGLNLANGAFDLVIGSFVQSPSNLTGFQKKNDFGLTKELYNTLQWQASSDATIFGYNLYRNGIKIAIVNASTLTYQDHNRKRGVTDTYSITAFDASGNESAPSNTQIN